MSKAKFRFYGLKLNEETDKDIIQYLDAHDNIQGNIKEVIRYWMKIIGWDSNEESTNKNT